MFERNRILTLINPRIVLQVEERQLREIQARNRTRRRCRGWSAQISDKDMPATGLAVPRVIEEGAIRINQRYNRSRDRSICAAGAADGHCQFDIRLASRIDIGTNRFEPAAVS